MLFQKPIQLFLNTIKPQGHFLFFGGYNATILYQFKAIFRSVGLRFYYPIARCCRPRIDTKYYHYFRGLGPSYSTSFSLSLRTGFSRKASSTTWATSPGVLAIIKMPLPTFGLKSISRSKAAVMPSIFKGNFLPPFESSSSTFRTNLTYFPKKPYSRASSSNFCVLGSTS